MLVRESRGYALSLEPDGVDAWRFERLVRDGTACLGSDPRRALEQLDEALALWRGTPLLDYRDEPWAEPEIARLTGLHTAAREHAFAARLESGQAALLVPELEMLVAGDPLREEPWRLLVLALYRSNRQAEALAALRRAREVLAAELGVDPGPALRALEVQVLAQSPSLAPTAAPVPAPAPTHAPPATPATPATPAQPAPAAPVGPAALPRLRVGDGEELVEREREVRDLETALADARAGQGQLVLVQGPAGIGKSRLLSEVRRRAGAAGAVVLRARGSELEQEFGFGAARQLFEPVLRDPGAGGRLLAGAAAAAGPVFDLLPGASGGEDISFATLHGLYWLTVNLASRGPLVVVVDDLHWCDSASLRYLAYLARRLEGLPVLVVGATRTGERNAMSGLLDEIAQDVATMAVRPGLLSRDGVRELVRGRLGADADEVFCSACHDTTSGNPLLLRQLLRALDADGVRPDASHADVVRAIGSRAVSSMVLLRLRRLPAAATAVARALAVLGDGAGLPAVAALAGLPEADAANLTEQLARAEILRPEPPLGFVHALVRDAVYRDLPPGERELAHDGAARLLGRTGAVAEQIAAQLLHAPRRADEWVVAVLRRAAAEAMRRGAPDGATTYLRRAFDEPPSAAERPEVLLDLGLAETGGEGPAALRHLRDAYDSLPDSRRRAAAAQMLARTMVFAGPPGAASAFARRAAADLPAELVDERQGLVALERVTGHMHGLDAASWGLGTEPPVAGDGPGARMLEAALAWERLCQGRPMHESWPLASRAIADGQLYAADYGLFWVVAIFIQDMADHEVLPTWDAALSYAHERGSLFSVLSVQLWRGFALLRRGDLLEAEESLRTALEQLEMWQATGVGSPYAEGLLARLLVERDETAQADALLARGHSAQPHSDGARILTEAAADVRLAQGRPADALGLLDAAARLLPHVVNPVWRAEGALRTRALHALGRTAEALAVAEDELRRARRWGAPSTVGRALRELGVLDVGAGVAHLEEAVALLAGSPARLDHGKALAALGAARLGSDRDEAAALLLRALEVADSCAAGRLRREVGETLASAGLPVPEGSRSGLAALTSSERRVARPLSRGATRREVAQALFLTPTAAERHIAEVRRKLGADGADGPPAAPVAR